ncbi:MAG: gephyrin-like molybdotransferase Glp [Bacteroidales bacterium]
MILFEQALEVVRKSALIPDTEYIEFSLSLGRVLAENVSSDMDMPPFDKSAMDGYACRKEDLPGPLSIIETIPAGVKPVYAVGKGQCAKIMTGSMLPSGADCVIKVEETEILDDGQIRFTAAKTHHNICYRGEDILKGNLVLEQGTLIGPEHIAVLAAVGKTNILAYRRLQVGILSTGDELVEPDFVPGESFIRNSNAWQLKAQVEKTGMIADYKGIAKDDKADLMQKIRSAERSNDVILLTGGVSMGDYDLVPEVLEESGYTILFRKIAVQPGSPTLFAVKENKRVFALPGNPVSSFIQFELLVKPFAFLSMGHIYKPMEFSMRLAATFNRKKSERLSLIPVRIKDNQVYTTEYHGSAHIHAYTYADGYMRVEPGVLTIEQGEIVNVRFI